ncbi:hypothetical protein CMV_005447 [Castanea mollissima]|uniref:Uncharacterized protein n=1 Tax=Castanea mollissima TaxID=60419 RepID=A0A8J4RXP7_9ROSI|nr:hypothetical protein CMV_005447 [Castanea mollissima]
MYGDLPPPSSADEDKRNNSTVWSSSAKMAPPTLRKSSSVFAPPQTILKSQTKAKTPNPALATSFAASAMPSLMQEDSAQPALVGVTSSVIEEYNPTRPNDYKESRRER